MLTALEILVILPAFPAAIAQCNDKENKRYLKFGLQQVFLQGHTTHPFAVLGRLRGIP